MDGPIATIDEKERVATGDGKLIIHKKGQVLSVHWRATKRVDPRTHRRAQKERLLVDKLAEVLRREESGRKYRVQVREFRLKAVRRWGWSQCCEPGGAQQKIERKRTK